MRAFAPILMLCVAIAMSSAQTFAKDDAHFGITRQTHWNSTFTFRDGRLRHEVSRFTDHWVEIFYNGSQEVFVRAGRFEDGKPVVTSNRFPEGGTTFVLLSSFSEKASPQRIYAGGEIYNLTENGFFEIMPDPSITARESSIQGAEYSNRGLDQLRKSFLTKPAEG